MKNYDIPQKLPKKFLVLITSVNFLIVQAPGGWKNYSPVDGPALIHRILKEN
jgi:hypothetical protein